MDPDLIWMETYDIVNSFRNTIIHEYIDRPYISTFNLFVRSILGGYDHNCVEIARNRQNAIRVYINSLRSLYEQLNHKTPYSQVNDKADTVTIQ